MRKKGINFFEIKFNFENKDLFYSFFKNSLKTIFKLKINQKEKSLKLFCDFFE
jgi:hypothetical protein